MYKFSIIEADHAVFAVFLETYVLLTSTHVLVRILQSIFKELKIGVHNFYHTLLLLL